MSNRINASNENFEEFEALYHEQIIGEDEELKITGPEGEDEIYPGTLASYAMGVENRVGIVEKNSN